MAREMLAVMEDRFGHALAGHTLARDRTLPLVGALADLFPEGGLRRGSTVTLGGASPGVTSLALALLSGPCAAGSWCAVVGAPDLGLVAATQFGADLERLALVPLPGQKWAVVVAALLEGFDVVLWRPGAPVGSQGSLAGSARQLVARARERAAVLTVLGAPDASWPGPADVHLEVVGSRWTGLGEGHGYLWGREVEVVASGKGATSQQRRAHLQFEK